MKKIIIFLTALVLLCAGTISAIAAENVGDTESPWAVNYINDARNLYKILPDSLTVADYTKPISRVEFCELAYKTMLSIAGTMGREMTYTVAEPSFEDTTNESVLKLVRAGIIRGKSDISFTPDAYFTREEAAVILARMAEHFGLQKFGNERKISDATDISGWASDGVDIVCGMGVMNGMGDGIFSPGGLYTREQSIATMMRLIGSAPYLNNRDQVYENRYFIFNDFYLWVEDENRNIIFKLPHYSQYQTTGYVGMRFFKKDGTLLVASRGPGSTIIYDVESSRTVVSVPSVFYALTVGGDYIIVYDVKYSAPTIDAGYDIYGVYDFDGNEIVSMGADWTYLYEHGYVDTKSSVFYIW